MKTDNHRTDLSEEGSGAACVFTEEEKNALRMLPEYMVVLRVRGSFGECLLATDLFLKSIQMDEPSFVKQLRRFSRFVYEDDIELILDTIRRSVAKPEFLCDFSVRIRKDDRNAYRKYKGAIRSVRTQQVRPGVPARPEDAIPFPDLSPDTPDTLVYIMSLDLTGHIAQGERVQSRMNQLLFREVLGQTRDCIFWKDTERRFVGVNQAFLDFCGFESEKELIGKTDEDMGWHPDPEPFRRDELRVLQGESTMLVHGTCMIRGKVRDILATKAPIYDGQTIIGFVGSFIDVTEDYARRREIERLDHELKKALDSERAANRNMTQFVSRMSHELRTPMNAVIGLSSLGMQTTDLDTAVEYLHKINSSGQYLLGIINDVLDINKIEGGQFRLVEENANLSDLFQAVDLIIRPLADAKGVHLLIDDNGLVIGNAICDRLRIQQILINLLNNAVKFTDAGGTVTMQVQQSVIHGRLRMTFLISDTGCGMSEEFQKRIFQPFVQENRNPGKYGTGTGLGLAISRTLARQMGGDITVESHESAGTVFTVTILLGIDRGETGRAGRLPGEETDERRYAGMRILLAEDNELNREVAVGLFSLMGLLVVCAKDGQEAVDLFRASPPDYYDAVFMDLQMPVKSGYEAAQEIRALSGSIPIVAMTADVFDASMMKARSCGMNDYITKPLDRKQILRIVREIAER